VKEQRIADSTGPDSRRESWQGEEGNPSGAELGRGRTCELKRIGGTPNEHKGRGEGAGSRLGQYGLITKSFDATRAK